MAPIPARLAKLAEGKIPQSIQLTMKLVSGSGTNLATTVTKAALDKKRIYDATNKANVKNLYRSSTIIMRIARGSIRRGKKASTPGNPPRHHTNPGLKLMNFFVDKINESAVVGVMPFGGASGIDVPHVLEYGGRMAVRRKKLKRTVHVRPRPFMAPAEEKARQKYPQLWKDSL